MYCWRLRIYREDLCQLSDTLTPIGPFPGTGFAQLKQLAWWKHVLSFNLICPMTYSPRGCLPVTCFYLALSCSIGNLQCLRSHRSIHCYIRMCVLPLYSCTHSPMLAALGVTAWWKWVGEWCAEDGAPVPPVLTLTLTARQLKIACPGEYKCGFPRPLMRPRCIYRHTRTQADSGTFYIERERETKDDLREL